LVQNKFGVTYSITDAEWERTAAERFDPEGQPIFYSFSGHVQMCVDSKQLLGENGYYMSVADLACGLADIIRRDLPVVGDEHTAVFEQGDDSLRIYFERHGDHLRISANKVEAAGETTVSAFFEGARAFLKRFAQEAATRVPDALDWKDLEVLRAYADS
jgi:hypothetical protein